MTQSTSSFDAANQVSQGDQSAPSEPGTGQKRLICVGNLGSLPEDYSSDDVLVLDSSATVLDQLSDQKIEGVWIARDLLPELGELRGLCQSGLMLRDFPEGAALLDQKNRVLWANRRLRRWFDKLDIDPVGDTIYEMMGNPEILGSDLCPFHTAFTTGEESSGTFQTESSRYYQVRAAPVGDHSPATQLVITVGDITEEILQQQKLAAIHRAGRELADLRPSEIFQMGVDERIDLLKDNIRHYLQDLLNFDVIEIRLLEQATGYLLPLLSVGIDQEAADRQLYAHPHGNGITGYAASSGTSYLCYDVINDPLFIPGVANSRSSLTVPLILNDQVLGTINVESPQVAAFTESDLQFLEIFARDISYALNTLELLVAQKADTAQQSCNAIHSAVAMPVDEILNDAVNVMEDYIGHSPEMVDRIRRILKNARDIKQTIQQIGQRMTPLEAVPPGISSVEHALLRDKRVLVVDEDATVREDAHRLLERYGCIVETARGAVQAVPMVRDASEENKYDVIISDIKLPEYSGFQLMMRLKELIDPVPMILMTGFGYDPGHSIVNALQNGLHPKARLYKPFRLDQLIDVVKTVLEAYAAADDADATENNNSDQTESFSPK
ncbi:response regulator [Rhodopirellula sp. MGV]|uniref:response regulator n=1 Tax=Rhodopirellula sp. MGV TaxID=2023130 RepID=UPI000B969087|nr:response regulator [Rhodopirellula sp. MGV]OYP36977.1 two-component system response regulator [Rhodopirellula sp. MGV]PNY36260.1 two-component system response regulator [Rhodopirellula baltica]